MESKTVLSVKGDQPAANADKVKRFNEAVKPLVEGIEGVSISVNSVLGAGDPYQTISDVTTLDDASTPVSIEHTEGTVMMIDFWATWCPPCQKPMQHNEDMLKENAEKWGDKVKIIGLSIDKDAETVKNHITNKGWTSPIHYHRAKSNCSDVYKVSGVPHVLIVDTKGKIVFKGHPANRPDLAKDFNDLLEGKTITGAGCEPGGDDKEEKEGEEDSKKATLDDIKTSMTQMDKFKNETRVKLQTDCKEECSAMMRNFLVCTLEASYDSKTESWTQNYMNHRVFVGAQDKLDTVKAKINEAMGEKAGEGGWNFTGINAQFIAR